MIVIPAVLLALGYGGYKLATKKKTSKIPNLPFAPAPETLGVQTVPNNTGILTAAQQVQAGFIPSSGEAQLTHAAPGSVYVPPLTMSKVAYTFDPKTGAQLTPKWVPPPSAAIYFTDPNDSPTAIAARFNVAFNVLRDANNKSAIMVSWAPGGREKVYLPATAHDLGKRPGAMGHIQGIVPGVHT